MDNNTILLIVALIAVYYFFFYSQENMTDLTPEQQSFVDGLYNHINDNDLTFDQYIDYLNRVQNINLNLIDNEVFVGFKLAKKKGTFTKQLIVEEMKL
jgi:5-methylthioribose kinase